MGELRLDQAVGIGARDGWLAVVSTVRKDSTVQASVVNAGALAHPITGRPVVAFVTYGRIKLANLRRRPQVTVAFRAGWEWAAVEGRAQLVGPDDALDGIDTDGLRRLLRRIFGAAGGTHDDWDAYDREMVAQGRTAVLIDPTRVYGN
jgi:PPOX class probable F420-dependent enzyme